MYLHLFFSRNMIKRVILFCTLAFAGLFLKAEEHKLDSLLGILGNEPNDTVLANTYREMADYYQDNSDSALTYSYKFLTLARTLNDAYTTADAYYRIAELYYATDIDSSLFYTKLYLEASFLTKDTIWIADAYNFLAYDYSQKGELIASLKNYQKALGYFENLKDSTQIASCYINIGYTISYSSEQEKSLQYFLRGMNLAQTIKDTSLLSDAYYNIAYYYYRIKDYKASFKYYKNSLDLGKNINPVDSSSSALIYADLAFLSLKLNRPEDFTAFMDTSKRTIPASISSYEKADLFSIYLDNYIEQGSADSAGYYLSLIKPILADNNFEVLKAYLLQLEGKLAFLNKDYKASIAFLTRSIVMLKKNNSIESFSDIYTDIAKAYAALNNHKEAYNWQLKANSYKDSLNLGSVERVLTEYEQSKIRTIELQSKQLELELTEQKMLNSNLQIRTKLRVTITLLVFLLVFVVISILFFRTIHNHNKTLSEQNELIAKQKALLEKQVVKLEESEKKLQELNVTKDKFFSIIAHDLRNPLHSIISLSELLLKNTHEMDAENVTKIMNSMNKTAIYGFSLLENLLDWARSQTGSITAHPEKIDMNSISSLQIHSFKEMAASKQIKIDLESEAELFAFADKNMVTTILRNLLHNAIKFSYENSTVLVQQFREGNRIVTCVKDTGIGIKQENLSKLFAIDSQVKKVGTHKEKGSGLGLILCKEFVENNNGSITVDCNEGQGCVFSFSLPVYTES